MSADVLFIHPEGHFNDLAVPTGAIGCMNAVSASKLGRYAFEVEDDEIRAARVVAVDLHWSIALPGFTRLVRHVRAVNPRVAIVAGGITAGHYPEELLAQHPVDYVIRGDSEVAFARLVDAILRGEPPARVPNTYGRGGDGPLLERMTDAEFDATDTLTSDWFPTLEKLVDVDAQAHSQCRVVLLARGCPLRCANSYGSFAETHGKGILIRSPESVVAQVALAAELGAKKLRFIASKIPPTPFTAQLEALAEAGPFRFESGIAIFLCRPPPPDQLALLRSAFDCEVTISAVPPMEHVPAVGSERLAEEEKAWSRIADVARGTERLRLHMCAIDPVSVKRAREEVIAEEPPKLMVFHGATWDLERPMDSGKRPLAELHAIMEPLWTFPAGRCLSPALGSLLEGFGFIDERGMEPGKLPVPEDARRDWWLTIARQWDRHRLPTLPGLKWSLLPVRRVSREALATSAAGATFGGATGVIGADDWAPIEAVEATPLDHSATLRGNYLGARLEIPAGANALLVLPHPIDGGPADLAWTRAIAGWGLAAIDLSAVRERRVRVELTIRVMEVGVAVLDAEDALLARGRIDLGLFRVKPRVKTGAHAPSHRPRPVLGG